MLVFYLLLVSVFAEINASQPAMSADNDVEEATKQVSGMTLQDTDNYNPDTVPYEVATFALS